MPPRPDPLQSIQEGIRGNFTDETMDIAKVWSLYCWCGLQVSQCLALFTDTWLIILYLWLRDSPASVLDTFPCDSPRKEKIFSIIEDQPCPVQDSVLPQEAPEINSKILADFRKEHVRALISCSSSPEGTIYSSLPWNSWRNFSPPRWWKKRLCLIEADRKNMRSFGHKWKTCLVLQFSAEFAWPLLWLDYYLFTYSPI